MIDIRTVTLIGVTGTMGANIAGIFASFGRAKVYCAGRDIEKVRKTLPRIIRSVRADAIENNLIPVDFSMLDDCIKESDLVFESSMEDLEVKKQIARRVDASLRPDAYSCTGTSGLSIKEIAECYSEENARRFFGVHMFNPPYSMPLCELIAVEQSDQTLQQELKQYLQSKLIRTVVEVKDSPAFLANRIGFQFINEALQYAETYKDNGGIDYIDAILGPFTGRAMAPLVTSDFVGLDVHKAIVDNLHLHTDDYANHCFILPDYVRTLISENKLGRKSSAGLYQTIRYENGLKRKTVYDISGSTYRDIIPYVFPFADAMKKHISDGDYLKAFECLINNHSKEAKICLHFLLSYIVYSLYVTKQVAYDISAADDVMAAGFNWCPPLALIGALSDITDVKKLIKEELADVSSLPDIDELFEEVKPSRYDYRLFFRSR